MVGRIGEVKLRCRMPPRRRPGQGDHPNTRHPGASFLHHRLRSGLSSGDMVIHVLRISAGTLDLRPGKLRTFGEVLDGCPPERYLMNSSSGQCPMGEKTWSTEGPGLVLPEVLVPWSEKFCSILVSTGESSCRGPEDCIGRQQVTDLSGGAGAW